MMKSSISSAAAALQAHALSFQRLAIGACCTMAPLSGAAE
jgi:hypothetical protein